MATKTNADYWRERKRANVLWQRKNMYTDELTQKQYMKRYEQVAKDIQAEIDREYRAYAAHENVDISDAMQAVSSEDVQAFASEAAELVRTHDFSDEANARLKLYNASMRINRLEYLKAKVGMAMTAATGEIENDMQQSIKQAHADEFQRQSGILSEYADEFDPQRVIKTVIKQYNPKSFSDLWGDQDVLKSKLDQALTNAMVRGMNPRVIARELRPLVGDTMKSAAFAAERITRTEEAAAQNAAQLESFEQNDIDSVKWIAEPDACKACAELDDKSFTLEEVPSLPLHPNCRCALAADPGWAKVDDGIAKFNAKYDEEEAKKKAATDSNDADLPDELSRKYFGGSGNSGAKLKALGGDSLISALADRLDQAPASIKGMFAKFRDKLNIDHISPGSGEDYYSPVSQGLHLSHDAIYSVRDSDYLGEHDVVYHEFGHLIDNQSRRAYGFSYAYMSDAPKYDLRAKIDADYQASLKPHLDAIMKEVTKDNPQLTESWDGSLNYQGIPVKFLKSGKLNKASAQALAQRRFRLEIRDKFGTGDKRHDQQVLGDVSDMLTVPSKQAFSFGIGHSKKYFSSSTHAQTTEFFAECTSATINNPESLAVIKAVFPESYKAYLQMTEDITAGKGGN